MPTLADLEYAYYARQLGITNPATPIGSLAQAGPDLFQAAQTINAQNNNPAGAAPAGSSVAVSVNGRATAGFQVVSNTLSQSLILQASLDGVNWFNVGGNVFVRQSDGALVPSIFPGNTGAYTAAVADFQNVRLSTPNAAVTGAASVVSSASSTPTIFTYDNAVASPASTVNGPTAFALTAATNTQLLAANPARRGAMIVNKSGQTVFLRFGATAASPSLYSQRLVDGAYYELPFGITTAIQAYSTLAGAAVGADSGLFVTEFAA